MPRNLQQFTKNIADVTLFSLPECKYSPLVVQKIFGPHTQERSIQGKGQGCDSRFYWTRRQRGELGEMDGLPVDFGPLFLRDNFDNMNLIGAEHV